jgi:hypothetical protein
VFGAEQSIGERSFEVLEKWLKEGNKSADELKKIVARIGGGLHRAELRARLQELLNAAPDSTAS